MNRSWVLDRGTPLTMAMARYRLAFVTVAILSAVLNVLLLGGSLYMMLVYDNVLPSHSIPTLFGLLAMIVLVYVFQALFDAMRGRILGQVAIDLDRQLARRVQEAVSEAGLRGEHAGGDGLTAMRDLDQLRSFLSGAGPAAMIDLPWIAFFLAILFLLHVWLGVTALAGALVMIAITAVTDARTRRPTGQLSQTTAIRNGVADGNLRHVETVTALGMRARMQDRLDAVNERHLAANDALARTNTLFGGMARIFRLFLQSAILTVGALLVIDGKASGGVIFASSILSGRALAPVDGAIANWRGFSAARLGWTRLNRLLAASVPRPDPVTSLPPPSADLRVEALTVLPPGGRVPVVRNASFALKAGDAMGIIGPSAAGKTSLGRALIGVWPPAAGSVRLDGATLDQWSTDDLGAHLGYLPQTVELMDGTVADNIARFEDPADSATVIAAARAAGIHDMIVALPQGYQTPVGFDGTTLSAGQRQRIGLARALYRDPFLVLLDEPNSNLDANGDKALEAAIAAVRARGGIVVVIAHRPATLASVNMLCVLRDGRVEAFGPRDETLARIGLTAPAPRPAPCPAIDGV